MQCSVCKKGEEDGRRFDWAKRRGPDGQPRRLTKCHVCQAARNNVLEKLYKDPERYDKCKKRGIESNEKRAKKCTKTDKPVRREIGEGELVCIHCKKGEGDGCRFDLSKRRGPDGQPRRLKKCHICVATRDRHLQKLYKDPERYDKCKERGTESSKKHAKTEQGKAIRIKIQKEAYKRKPLQFNLLSMFNAILNHRIKGDNSKLLKKTLFSEGAHVIEHFHKHQLPGEWNIDHIIPRCQYDHSDPEDVKNCWSPENMRSLLREENDKKSKKIVPSLVATVPVRVWPRAWGGVMPKV